MNIGLNLLFAGEHTGGSHIYLLNFINNFIDMRPNDKFFVYLNSKNAKLFSETKNVKIIIIRHNPNNKIFRLFYENLIMPILLIKYDIKYFYCFANLSPFYTPCKTFVVVHDLLFFYKSNTYSISKAWMLRLLMKLSTFNSKAIFLPISDFTKSEMKRLLKLDEDRMIVMPFCLSKVFDVINNEGVLNFKIKYNLPDKYWLYVAHTYEHKNHINLLKAFQIINSKYPEIKLVLRGDPKDNENIIDEFILNNNLADNVIRLGWMNYDELPYLYHAAYALVFVSLFEGGGIPIIEALSCGTYVISSNLPSVKEYVSDKVKYVNAEDVDEIVSAMETRIAITDDKLNQIKNESLNSVKKFRYHSFIERLNNLNK
jgi:glycosyltransferase involved in cell wall biosynthesis